MPLKSHALSKKMLWTGKEKMHKSSKSSANLRPLGKFALQV